MVLPPPPSIWSDGKDRHSVNNHPNKHVTAVVMTAGKEKYGLIETGNSSDLGGLGRLPWGSNIKSTHEKWKKGNEHPTPATHCLCLSLQTSFRCVKGPICRSEERGLTDRYFLLKTCRSSE